MKKNFNTLAGTLEVLKDVNLQVRAGEIFWTGEKITGRGNAFLAQARTRLIAYVFQSYHLVPELTALENVLLAAKIAGMPMKRAREEALALLEKVGLQERVNHLPVKLSGGECQRVAIARALINHAPLILADEPTGNLDEHTGESVMQLLLQLCEQEKTALILVTHNNDFAMRTQRKLILKDGVLVG